MPVVTSCVITAEPVNLRLCIIFLRTFQNGYLGALKKKNKKKKKKQKKKNKKKKPMFGRYTFVAIHRILLAVKMIRLRKQTSDFRLTSVQIV